MAAQQSTLDLHPSLTDFSTLQNQIALDKAIPDGLHTLRANEVGALQARCTALENRCAALEAAQLTFLGAQGGTPVPVYQIQVAPDLQWAYYNNSKTLWIQQDPPTPSDPYYP